MQSKEKMQVLAPRQQLVHERFLSLACNLVVASMLIAAIYQHIGERQEAPLSHALAHQQLLGPHTSPTTTDQLANTEQGFIRIDDYFTCCLQPAICALAHNTEQPFAYATLSGRVHNLSQQHLPKPLI